MIRFSYAAAGLAALLMASSCEAVVVLSEDFEDATVGYTLNFTDPGGEEFDYFRRSNESMTPLSESLIGADGAFFGAHDVDGVVGGSNPGIMTFSFPIAGFTDLSFSALFAEGDDGSSQDWDDSDFFNVTASIDGATPTTIFQIANDGSQFNSAPFIDTDLDGTGDGDEITNIFTEYGAAIAGTGSVLDLVLTFSLNSGDEDLAIDNFVVSGTSVMAAIPEPTAALFGSLLAGALGLTVARRPLSRD